MYHHFNMKNFYVLLTEYNVLVVMGRNENTFDLDLGVNLREFPDPRLRDPNLRVWCVPPRPRGPGVLCALSP